MAATECFICGLSLAQFDEAAATFHLNGCLDNGKDTTATASTEEETVASRLSSAGLVFLTRTDNAECPICGQSFTQDVLQDHVEACLLSTEQSGPRNDTNGHIGASSSEPTNNSFTTSTDSCPCCLLEWTAIDVPFSDRGVHVEDCLSQQAALAEDDDGYHEDDGDHYVTEQDMANMLNVSSSRGNGFGRFKAMMHGKARDTNEHNTGGLIPVLQTTFEKAMLSPQSPTRRAVLCNANVLHIKSQFGDFGWGCGYKSACMVFSAIRHLDSYSNLLLQGEQQSLPADANGYRVAHAFKRKLENDEIEEASNAKLVAPLLSIEQMQQIVEEAWKAGFDPPGKRHFNGKLVGSKRWIGTSEVYVLFTWLGIRATVIDFPRTAGSSGGAHYALAKWVFDYFQMPLDAAAKSKDTFGALMSSGGSAVRICDDRMPLYLQHQGHSRTIVGVEQTKNGDLNLLLFDCGKKVSAKLKEAAENKDRPAKKAKSPVTSTSGTGDSAAASKLIEPYRVNLKDLSRKDEYQILCVETDRGPLSLMEKLGRRKLSSIRVT